MTDRTPPELARLEEENRHLRQTVEAVREEMERQRELHEEHVQKVQAEAADEVVVGPRYSEERPPQPMLLPVDGAHEVAGVGVLAPNQDGKPVLHIHAALGRSGQTMSGCLRPGVTTWLVGEVILYEILGAKVTRVRDEESGFDLLETGVGPEAEV